MMNYGAGYYNPISSAQQRLNALEQQYPQYAQQPVLNAVPVTDIAEANAYRVDLSGTPTIFYNRGKNEIYLKKINSQSGGADFLKFTLAECPMPEKVQKEENLQTLSSKIDGLYSLLNNYQNSTPVQPEQNEPQIEQVKAKAQNGAWTMF